MNVSGLSLRIIHTNDVMIDSFAGTPVILCCGVEILMRTILVVDDEEGFLHILQVVLNRAGFTTITANNALDAQRQVTDTMPDLIMHSAGLKIHDKAHIQRIGADAVLPKPSQPRDIVEMVKRFVGATV
jgi:CheY-like chemotaxis protein